LSTEASDIPIASGTVELRGDLNIPAGAEGLVVFAHGSGSSRHSKRNQFVALTVRESGVGTLLIDLLTQEEAAVDIHTAHLRFDIDLLARRLVDATDWVKREHHDLRVGYFGSSTGGAGALRAAAVLGEEIAAVVSRGGRADLAGSALTQVRSPTLLIVGGFDYPVIEINAAALLRLRCEKELKIVPGATHLFEEPGALERVADLSADWFKRHLVALAEEEEQ